MLDGLPWRRRHGRMQLLSLLLVCVARHMLKESLVVVRQRGLGSMGVERHVLHICKKKGELLFKAIRTGLVSCVDALHEVVHFKNAAVETKKV